MFPARQLYRMADKRLINMTPHLPPQSLSARIASPCFLPYTASLVNLFSQAVSPLVGIKLLHTVVWLFFASCIFALPVTALRRRFDWAAGLSALVLLECLVLALNRFRCPLTDIAARFTPDRAANFDIYLPVWLAQHNKTIFGTLFLVGELFVLWRWLFSKR
jgi:hypothetical protein